MNENISDQEALFFLQNNPDKAEMAFVVIWDRYYMLLCRFAFKLVGDLDDANDIVSEVFVRLWSGRAKVRHNISNVNVKIYLTLGVYNHVRNWVRGKKRQIGRDKQWIEGQTFISPRSADHAIIESEFYYTLYKALESLPPRTREIFLAYFEGEDTESISKRLGLRPQTVLNQKARAIKMLAGLLGNNAILIFLIVTLRGN